MGQINDYYLHLIKKFRAINFLHVIFEGKITILITDFNNMLNCQGLFYA